MTANVLQQIVLPFSSSAAQWFAALVSHREGLGRPISTADAVIAATAQNLMTDNWPPATPQTSTPLA